MDLIAELNALGADTDEGLDRVMGDRDLYELMLGMLLDTVRDAPIAPEDFAGDLEAVIGPVHKLKGITGNLSLTPLFDGYTQTLVLLRDGQAAKARAEFERLLPLQSKFLDCIRRHKNA